MALIFVTKENNILFIWVLFFLFSDFSDFRILSVLRDRRTYKPV